jgi:hypothetical protein
VKLLADRYEAANFQVDDNVRSLLTTVDDPVGIITRIAAANPNEAEKFNRLLTMANEVQNAGLTAAAPSTGDIFGGFIVPWIVAPILVMILFVVVTLLWGILIYPNIVGPFIAFIKRGGKPDTGKEELKRIREEKVATEKAKAEAAERMKSDTRGAPVFQKISNYAPGRSYDESFAIETADDVFLGECGASISETTGDEKKVAAIEVWIFDKEDFTKTLTQVFVAPAGFADPAARARLETRGDLIEAKPGAVANFETQTLLMEVRVADIAYATGGGIAPNGAFERLRFEFAVWTKSGQGMAKAAGAVMGQASFAPPPTPQPLPAMPPAQPMPTYAPPPAAPSFAPPTTPAPAYNPPPLTGSPGFTPLTPPPLVQPPPAAPRPPQQDDDLFGGTGDFTPVN